MRKILIINLYLFLLILNPALSTNENYVLWKKDLKKEAVNLGISLKTFEKHIETINTLNKKVLSNYKNQPEFKISFDDYYNRNITSKRVKKGNNLLNQYTEILTSVYEKYSVKPQIILSIWALESNYGTYTGNFDVIDALNTLAFASKRNKFFRKELLNILMILDKNLIERDKLKGSWAGAMGQSQFMPSSYLNYAVDFNSDNKIDIWNTYEDIFASISNYLSKHGWRKNDPWCFELNNNKDNASYLKNLKDKQSINIQELVQRKLLIHKNENFNKSLSGKIKIIRNSKNIRYFVVFKNFEVLKRYNNSDFYALTLGSLANKYEK
tara:strand:- start:2108 stop:3082 length:975 start_codon:yes stop_codon:yes gene_type:complete